jgi:Zn-finger nucleic acid-binding protein
MKCPNCDHLLQITERQNVEIDYCPSCRGVWLDKGELDKIIDFANQQISLLSKKRTDDDDNEKYNRYFSNEKKDVKYTDNRNISNKPYKKKSFLGDLFDFD